MNCDLISAQNLSRVGPLKGTNIESYSGFFTVNKTTNSNMFFWFFPAQVMMELLNKLLSIDCFKIAYSGTSYSSAIWQL
jgi:hypothetical protein